MKKNNVRDYATEAFRFYARIAKHPERILCEEERSDINAVSETLDSIRSNNEPHAAEIIMAVYGLHPDKTLHRRDISSRVIQAALAYRTNERKVYKILKEARETFAVYRGLRLEN